MYKYPSYSFTLRCCNLLSIVQWKISEVSFNLIFENDFFFYPRATSMLMNGLSMTRSQER